MLTTLVAACSGGGASLGSDPVGEEPDIGGEDGGGGDPGLPLVADFDVSNTVGPAPLVVDFADMSSGTVTSWTWDFGDGGVSNERNPSHLYVDPGFYDVSLTVNSPTGADTLTRESLITVADAGLVPVAGFSATPTSGVAPLAVSFNDASAGFVTSWSWSFGDGATSNQASPNHLYTAPGAYDVSLTVSGPLGTNTLTRPGYVIAGVPAPVPDFVADTTLGMAPLTVRFTDLTTGIVTAREWSFGDGTPPLFAINPTHVYEEPGTYTVRLRVLGPGGVAGETKTNYITVAASEPAPIAVFQGSPTFGVAPLQVGFTDLSSGTVTSWSWDFGDGSTSNAPNPSHTYTNPGSYTVSLTATGPGGSDTAVLPNHVTASAFTPPTANFMGSPSSGTAPLNVAFTELSTGDVTGWGWDFGDGVTSTQRNPVHTYTGPGRYTVTLAVIGPAGTDAIIRSEYIDVSVPAPVANFNGTPTSGDFPLAVQFNDLTSGDVNAWGWDFGDGVTSTLRNPSHTYQGPGNYTVTLVVAGPGGADVRTRVNYIQVSAPAPDASFFATPTNGTAPLNVQFTDVTTGPVDSWSWNFGDGSSSSQQNPSHVYDEPGNYSVTLTVTGPGGTDSRTRFNYIQVGAPAPVAAFSGTPTSGTAPLDVQFFDGSTGDVTSWSWSFGDGGTSGAASPSHRYDEPGTYTVSLTVNGPGGSDTRTRTNYIQASTAAPVAQFSGTPTSGTAPLDVQFFDGSTGDVTSWSWSFGDGEASNAASPSHRYDEAGTYTVSLTVNGPGGSDTRTRTNYIQASSAAPVAQFSGNPTSGEAPLTVQFVDGSSGEITSRSWSFGDGATSSQANPSHVYDTSGTYDVSLTVTGPGGSDTTTLPDFVTVGAAAPAAWFVGTPTSGDVPLTVQFSDASTGEVESWAWDFGDGGTSTAQNPSHTYTESGVYSVRLTVTGPGGSDARTRANFVTVGAPAPTASFTGGPTKGVAPLTVVFQDQSTGVITARVWDFGDGATSGQVNPTHIYTSAGTYDVTLTVSGPDGNDSFTRSAFVTVEASGPPDASFTGAPLSGDAPLGVIFQDTTAGDVTAWSWNFGDGSISTTANPSHVYTEEGEYTVSLAVSGPGGSDSIVMPNLVTVSPPDASPDCDAEDAQLNTVLPLKQATYDYVPVVPDGSLGFYTVYSARNLPDGTPEIGNNVGIFLFQMPNNEVLMFGSGYGDRFVGVQGPLFSAEFDMDMVDEVIQGCMGLDPAATIIRIVTPHGHRDHVNPESVVALRALGYSIGDIYIHEGDFALVSFMGWFAQDSSKFRLIEGTGCESELFDLNTDSGRIWFLNRPGHTNGALDAVLEVGGDPNDRVLIRGSVQGGCNPPTGTQLIIDAHGNVVLDGASPAPSACTTSCGA